MQENPPWDWQAPSLNDDIKKRVSGYFWGREPHKKGVIRFEINKKREIAVAEPAWECHRAAWCPKIHRLKKTMKMDWPNIHKKLHLIILKVNSPKSLFCKGCLVLMGRDNQKQSVLSKLKSAVCAAPPMDPALIYPRGDPGPCCGCDLLGTEAWRTNDWWPWKGSIKKASHVAL